MKVRVSTFGGLALALLIAGGFAMRIETPAGEAKPAKVRRRADAGVPAESKERVTVSLARDRAAQLHAFVDATLHAMHRHYFHKDKERVPVPARALKDVFSDIGRESRIDVRWIAVNTPAMSIDHEPEDDFEKQAAKEIAAGRESFERIEAGSYRRAGAITLGASCTSCHAATSFGPPSAKPRYAGLVISVPIVEERPNEMPRE